MLKNLSPFILVTLLFGCASPREPAVPTYTGLDVVTELEASAVIGTWDTQILNPREGQENNRTEVTYTDDGRFSGSIIPTESSESVLDDTQLVLTGDWIVSDGVLTHQNVTLSTEDDNAYAAFIIPLLNNISRELGGSANVYELSANHIILVGEDGIATRYDRREL